MNLLSLVLGFVCAAGQTLVVYGSSSDPVVLVSTDLGMERVAENSFSTLTGTVIGRFARNLLKLTKILIFKDKRCEGLVGVWTSVGFGRIIAYDFGANLKDGIGKLTDVLLIRARRINGDRKRNTIVENLKTATEAVRMLYDDKGTTVPPTIEWWDLAVIAPLESLFGDSGLKFFGIVRRKELRKSFAEINGLMNSAAEMILDYPKVGNSPVRDSTMASLSNELSKELPLSETIRAIDRSYKTKLSKVATSKKVQALLNFARSFLKVSLLIKRSPELISSKGETKAQVSERISNIIGRMIHQDLLPSLNNLMVNQNDPSRFSSLIIRGMRMAKVMLELHLRNEGKKSQLTSNFGVWTRDIYKNVLRLFNNGRFIGGTALPPEWAQPVAEMFNPKK